MDYENLDMSKKCLSTRDLNVYKLYNECITPWKFLKQISERKKDFL